MDKIFSARVDESALSQLELLSRQLKTTKKDVIERAIRAFAEQIEDRDAVDVLAATSGAWQRQETVAKTVSQSRKIFRQSMERRRR